MSLTSKDPNIRYANGFLNLKYKDKAITDESMLDKTSGELFYKRKSDNKIISFTRDNKDVADILETTKSLIDTNIQFKKPSKYNAPEYYSDTYFMSLNYDVSEYESSTTNRSLLSGAIYLNNESENINVSLETNGFFIGLYTGPRNKPSIDYLTGLYDNYVKNYNSDDTLNDRKSKYDDPTYDMSNIVIEYRYTLWKENTVVIKYNNVSNVRLNEVSYVQIFDDIPANIHDIATHATIEIDRIYSDKLSYAYKNLLSESELNIVNSLIDITDFEINYGTMSFFTCTSESPKSGYVIPSSKLISNISLFMPLNVFEQWITQIGNIGNNSGIIVSINQPNEEEWAKVTIWAEQIRKVYSKSEVIDTGASTSFDELDKFFGASDIIIAPLTLDSNVYGYYVNLLRESKITV